jgi:anti-sigma B factor antagonist
MSHSDLTGRWPARLRAEWFSDHGTTVAPSGELDLAVADRFRAMISRQIGSGCRHLIIDLSATTFFDSSAMSAFLSGIAPLRHDPSAAVVLVNPHAIVRSYLDLSGVGAMFTIFSTRDEAIAALQGAQRGSDGWRLAGPGVATAGGSAAMADPAADPTPA